MAAYTPKYAYADLYGEMERRQEHQRAEALRLIRQLRRLKVHGLYAPEMAARLSELERSIPKGPPPRHWKHAIGLSVSATVSKGAAAGTYSLEVVRSDNPDGFELVLDGPRRSMRWWPSTGISETDALVSIGGWRHTLSRFFGLEIRVSGHTKANKRKTG